MPVLFKQLFGLGDEELARVQDNIADAFRRVGPAIDSSRAPMTFGTDDPQDVGDVGGAVVGTSSGAAHSDHVHAHGSLTTADPLHPLAGELTDRFSPTRYPAQTHSELTMIYTLPDNSNSVDYPIGGHGTIKWDDPDSDPNEYPLSFRFISAVSGMTSPRNILDIGPPLKEEVQWRAQLMDELTTPVCSTVIITRGPLVAKMWIDGVAYFPVAPAQVPEIRNASFEAVIPFDPNPPSAGAVEFRTEVITDADAAAIHAQIMDRSSGYQFKNGFVPAGTKVKYELVTSGILSTSTPKALDETKLIGSHEKVSKWDHVHGHSNFTRSATVHYHDVATETDAGFITPEDHAIIVNRATLNATAVSIAFSATRGIFSLVGYSASITLTLPLASSVAAGTVFGVVDGDGNLPRYPCTVVRSGSNTINGLTSYMLDTAFGSVEFVGDGVSKWRTC